MEIAMNNLFETLIMGGFAVLTALASYGINEAVKYIKSKSTNEIVNSTLDRLHNSVNVAVEAMEITVAKDLREAVKDGKIDRNELLQLSGVVKEEVLKGLSDDVLNDIATGVGDVDSYLDQLITVAVEEIKNKTK